MGNVIKQGPRVYRFIVNRREDINLLILLFNGNIILPTRKVQFNKFLIAFNDHKKTSNPIPYITSSNLPSLDNQWILGFTEAEGSFNTSLLSNSYAFRTRFLLSQKGDINLPILSNLILLFNTGKIEGNSKKDNYSFIISGLSNVTKIYNYFDKNLSNFIGIKKYSYLAFKDLNSKLEQGLHLDLNMRNELVTLSHNINISRKFK